MKVPFVDLKLQYQNMKAEIDTAIENVINDTAFIKGKYVSEFEKNFAELYGVKHVISCGNGTDSLYIIMKMLGIKEGDEVITAAHSWISSSETIVQAGATPVFVDPDGRYLSMSAEGVRKAITDKTKAVMAVHLHGQACEMDAIKELCEEKGIYLFEDCAQAHFSEHKGKRVGTMGIAGSFSFYPGKNLGAYGDAGCMMTNDDELAERLRMYANHGALKKHHHKTDGINSRMDGFQGAVLNAKLPYILDWTESRIKNAAMYSELLADVQQVKTPITRPDSKHTFHVYMIMAENRDALQDHLNENGIATAIHYPTALPLLPVYSHLNLSAEGYSVARKMMANSLSLPMYPEMTEEQISFVVQTIKDFYSK